MLELVELTESVRDLSLLVESMKQAREPVFRTERVSDTSPWVVSYRNRKHLYIFSPSAVSLKAEDLGSLVVPANTLTFFPFDQGMRIFSSTAATQYTLLVIATDELLQLSGVTITNANPDGQALMVNSSPVVIASDQTLIPVISTSQIPQGATPLTASSGNVANAVAAATLTSAVGRTAYITGFAITGSGATAALVVSVTVTGLIGGTATFTYAAAAGVAVENTPLIITFPTPLIASATNVNIVVSCPALGAGNTNNTANAFGYLL